MSAGRRRVVYWNAENWRKDNSVSIRDEWKPKILIHQGEQFVEIHTEKSQTIQNKGSKERI